MRLLLVDCIGDARSYLENKYPAIGLAYLASHLRESPLKADIEIAASNVEEAIVEFRPDVVGISSVSQNFNKAREIASICKDIGSRVVVGGIHISSLPSCLNRNMDIGVIGEGEETFLQLLRLYDGTWDAKVLHKVEGIVFHSGNALEVTPARPLVEPLDRLPFPARDLLRNEGNEAYMFTSRGCPYRCIFCASSRFWLKWRRFSAQYVVNEIKDLLRCYPHVRTIKMFDDLFIADRKRLEQIAELLRSEGLHKRVNLLVSATANLIDDEIVGLLKQMNVTEVGIGLESGCERTLAFLKQGVTCVQDNANAIRKLKDSGIWVTGTFVIGSPKETREDIMETLNFIRKTPLDKASVFILTPYPNTPLWDILTDKGLFSRDTLDSVDWSIFDQCFSTTHYRTPTVSENLSQQELVDLFKLFRREERLISAKWGVKLVFRQPSKVVNYMVRRMKRLL